MEYTALYRRFRPKTFSEILGQDHITQTLKNQVIANRVGHAYLFTGCRGCGKTSAAKVLSRAINCLNPKDGEPCNECSICKAALDGSLTDMVEMDAASNNSVDDVRAIRDEVNFLPTLAKYRVYIIDEVHMLSTGAFNALLKTLEEPPQHVKFILATTEPQKLPATILSRCQRFDFKKISEDKIIENINKICKECKIDYNDSALNLIAELSEGAMRDALSILERCAQDGENYIDDKKIKKLVGIPETTYILNIMESIIKYDVEKAIIETETIINEGKDVNNILWEMIKLTRDLMLMKSTGNISNIYTKQETDTMKSIIKNIETERMLKIIYKLSELENDIKWSSQRNIVFQVGILNLCRKESMTLEERIEKLESVIKNGNVKITNQLSTNTPQKVEKIQQKTNKPTKKEAISENDKTNESGSNSDIWTSVLEKLKEARKPMLYSNLINAKGKMIDDMTYGIEFSKGLTSFGRSIIEKPENMEELRKLVSIECKKDMRIKLIDKKEQSEKNESNSLDLGIDINIIE